MATHRRVDAVGSSTGFASRAGRVSKALKIRDILREEGGQALAGRRPLLLDIGAGSGEICRHLADDFSVVGIDIEDQRSASGSFQFARASALALPFADKSFDVVVSNHVIEHLPNASAHLREIARVLRDDGMVYLATPNRWWPWEVHYKLPLLHFLPHRVFLSVLKTLKIYREDVRLVGWRELRNATERLGLAPTIVNDRVCKWPRRYHLNCSDRLAAAAALIPLPVLRIAQPLHPTFIVVLRKTKAGRLPVCSAASRIRGGAGHRAMDSASKSAAG